MKRKTLILEASEALYVVNVKMNRTVQHLIPWLLHSALMRILDDHGFFSKHISTNDERVV